jgi:glutathione S-transferase
MIIYGATLSPYVRKTLAYVAEKGIEVESRPTSPLQPDPEFLAASPFRRIPAFKDGDFTISDSTAIITYLEAKHPEPPLLPAEPCSRARTIWFEEFADTIVIGCMGKVFFNRIVAPKFLNQEGDQAVADKAISEELPPIIDYIEKVIPDSGFLVDDRLTLADLAVASPFVNLEHAGVTVDPAKHPKTVAFLAAIHARPSFAPIIAQEKAFFGR